MHSSMKWTFPLFVFVVTRFGLTSEPESQAVETAPVPKFGETAPTDGSQENRHWQLTEGELYFRIDGVPTFVTGRNPTGTIDQFDESIRFGAANGEQIVRIHLTPENLT